MDKISNKNLKKSAPFFGVAAFLILMLLIPPARAFFVGVFGWAIIPYVILLSVIGGLVLFGKRVKMRLSRASIAIALVVMMICTLHILFAKKIFREGNYMLDPYRGFDTVGGVIVSALTAPVKLLFRNNYTAMLSVYFVVTAILGLLMIFPYVIVIDQNGWKGIFRKTQQQPASKLHTEKVQKASRPKTEWEEEPRPKAPVKATTLPEGELLGPHKPNAADILFGGYNVKKPEKKSTYEDDDLLTADQFPGLDIGTRPYTNQGMDELFKRNQNQIEEYEKRYGNMTIYGQTKPKDAPALEPLPKEPENYSYFSDSDWEKESEPEVIEPEEVSFCEEPPKPSFYVDKPPKVESVKEDPVSKKLEGQSALDYINTPVDPEEYCGLFSSFEQPQLYTEPIQEEPLQKADEEPKEEKIHLFEPLLGKTKENEFEPEPEKEPESFVISAVPVKKEEPIAVVEKSVPVIAESPKESGFIQKDTPYGTRIRMSDTAPKAEPITPKEVLSPKKDDEDGLPELKPKVPYKPVPYNAPPLDLMKLYPNAGETFPENYVAMKANIDRTMEEFGVPATVTGAKRGPTFTRYELALGAGYPVKKIVNLEENLMMRLKVKSLRILAPIRGEDALGIEVPNEKRDIVGLRSVLSSKEFNTTDKGIQIAFGKTLEGDNYVADLAKMPHLLVAGATGTGKSVFINSLIVSMLYKYGPEDVRLLLIDPKRVEMAVYRNLPNLLISETVKEPQQAVNLLKWLTEEMDRRYAFLEEKGCNQIDQYNENVRDKEKEPKMYRIVLIVDEMADLMMKGKGQVEEYIVRIAQLARAAGIHMVLATQRPTQNVITGLIKGNILARVGFTVKSNLDSRVIFDEGGAESLLGNGDMIYSFQSELTRMQGAFVSNDEVREICSYIRAHNEARFDANIAKEILNVKEPEPQIDLSAVRQEQASADFEEKLKMVLKGFILDNRASVSSAQSKFGVGYIKAKKLVDAMTERGYLSKEDGAKPRDILITLDEYYEIFGRE